MFVRYFNVHRPSKGSHLFSMDLLLLAGSGNVSDVITFLVTKRWNSSTCCRNIMRSATTSSNVIIIIINMLLLFLLLLLSLPLVMLVSTFVELGRRGQHILKTSSITMLIADTTAME
jgi:hypothetical protein